MADSTDALYNDQLALYNKRLQSQLGNIGYERTQTQQEYGLEDTTDPYSRARLMERAYQQQRSGITNQAASAGQLYSGSYRTGQGEALYQNERGQAGLRKEYLNALRGYAQRETGAQEDYAQSTLGARGDLLQRQLDQGPQLEYPAPTPQAAAANAGWTPQQAAGGPSPGPGYKWNPTAFKWVRTGPSPGKGYKWDFAGNRWVRK